MSKILSVSALSYCKSLKLHELGEEQFKVLPISSYRLPDGSHQIISIYPDEEWRYEDTRFPSNTGDSQKKLRFKSIPKRFVPAVKFAIKHYDMQENPSGGTLTRGYSNLAPFLRYLDSLNVQCFSGITPLICANYVERTKGMITSRGKRLAKSSLVDRFLAVERLFEHLQGTRWAFTHPWEESSAKYLAGLTGQTSTPKAKTVIVPEDQLQVMIQYCQVLIEQGHELAVLEQRIRAKRSELQGIGLSRKPVEKKIKETILIPNGYSSLREFNRRYNDIPIAAAIIILTFSGVRNHELCAIEWNDRNSDRDAYRIEDNENDVNFWLKSHSSKTHEGYTEWLVPKLVIDAIEVQKAYVRSFREELWQEQQRLFEEDLHHPRGIKIEGFKHHLFLSKSAGQGNQINSLTNFAFDYQLKRFCESLGINGMASHRFRRTFAVYCSQSAYGDLRYLKQHFKHWSMDMTLLYAGNEAQDAELYDEIAIEIKNYKVSRVEEFLDEDTIITGGLANKLISYRSKNEAIKTFESRAEMAEKVSDSVHLRSTGHSWCTSDNSACGGRSVIEGTRCVDCAESIIEKERHGDYYKRIYIQQLELKQIDDIGEAGKQRVERDIQRCERVLKEFGLFEEVKRVS